MEVFTLTKLTDTDEQNNAECIGVYATPILAFYAMAKDFQSTVANVEYPEALDLERLRLEETYAAVAVNINAGDYWSWSIESRQIEGGTNASI